jgi:uncharacterized protein YggE
MREHLRQATLTAAVCVLAIAAYTAIRGGSDTASARAASAPSGDVLHVTGAATVNLKPDRAVISFTTHGRGPTLAAAQNRASRKMRAVIAAMTAGGVAGSDMQTHDQYATRAARHVAGYVADQSLTVTVRDISRAGKLDAAGVSAGAHSSEGPVFSLAGKQRGYRAALAAAVKQARSQAAAMAAAAGLRITGVVSIQEDENDRYAVFGAASADALAPARTVAVPTRPGRSQVSASVTAVFADAPAA